MIPFVPPSTPPSPPQAALAPPPHMTSTPPSGQAGKKVPRASVRFNFSCSPLITLISAPTTRRLPALQLQTSKRSLRRLKDPSPRFLPSRLHSSRSVPTLNLANDTTALQPDVHKPLNPVVSLTTFPSLRKNETCSHFGSNRQFVWMRVEGNVRRETQSVFRVIVVRSRSKLVLGELLASSRRRECLILRGFKR